MNLDDMLTTPQAALWLNMTERELLAKTKGRKPAIPGFWINRRVVRFHPRTIIAKMARDAGVDPETVALSFGLTIVRNF